MFIKLFVFNIEWTVRRGWRYSSPSGIRRVTPPAVSGLVVNLTQSPDVVEASTGDLVDVVLRGQLTVHVDTEVPDDNVTVDYRPTDLN